MNFHAFANVPSNEPSKPTSPMIFLHPRASHVNLGYLDTLAFLLCSFSGTSQPAIESENIDSEIFLVSLVVRTRVSASSS